MVAMGSATYGEDTGNDASSHCEVLKWNKEYEAVWGPIMPVRLIGPTEDFLHDTAKKVFSNDPESLSIEFLGFKKQVFS